MAGVVLIGSKDSPVEVTGAHGGTSSLLWKPFTDGNMMWSDLQSFEHVTVPPGGNVGLHVHSRTEEIYFILTGRGRMRVGDESREVGPGDLILTPLHTAHSHTHRSRSVGASLGRFTERWRTPSWCRSARFSS